MRDVHEIGVELREIREDEEDVSVNHMTITNITDDCIALGEFLRSEFDEERFQFD